MNIYIRSMNGALKSRVINEKFTWGEFLEVLDDALAVDRAHVLTFRYVVGGKPLNIIQEKEFNTEKHLINKDCTIMVLGRLLGGAFQGTLQTIVELELDSELDKVAVHSEECNICFSDSEDCLKVCCVWMCKEDIKRWLLEKMFKISCTVCRKAVPPKDLFQTGEYVATIQALDEEKQLLKNIDCQRCLDCNALLCNDEMFASVKCLSCTRKFCFFCCRPWNTSKMKDGKYTCGDNCLYEIMITFDLIPFHYNKDIKIPSRRVCPKCFNYGAYDNKCKYHTCFECKFTFCFLCLKEESECKLTYKSSYDHVCVKTPVPQSYSMFPRLFPDTGSE